MGSGGGTSVNCNEKHRFVNNENTFDIVFDDLAEAVMNNKRSVAAYEMAVFNGEKVQMVSRS